MGYISDAQLEVTVEVLQSGIANILEESIIAPNSVKEDQPFDIKVTIKNDGETDTIYAQLLDSDNDVIEGTLQEQELDEGEEWEVTFNLPGYTGIDTFVCTIDAGHKTED